jgi:hypothetical protein
LAVIERVESAAASWRTDWASRRPNDPMPFEVTPRLMLVHTLAHALIRQLTLECGYSSASLRERLYITTPDQEMAGILIYTSTSDSDGTLGGLERRASKDLWNATVIGALMSLRWCASDPLCIGGETGAPDAHSIAACHSCILVPETSCEQHNKFLDRGLLIGTDADNEIGYFSDLLTEQD